MKLKKIAVLSLTAAIGLTMVNCVFATNEKIYFSEVSDIQKVEQISESDFAPDEEVEIPDGVIDIPSARNNYVIINNEDITTSDKTWDQPNGYSYYRFYIKNTRNEKLKVTLRYGKTSKQYTIDGNKDKTVTMANAQPVKHTLSFSSDSGIVSGKVNVRVSDTKL